MASNVGSAYVVLRAEMDELKKGLAQAQSDIKRWASTAQTDVDKVKPDRLSAGFAALGTRIKSMSQDVTTSFSQMGSSVERFRGLILSVVTIAAARKLSMDFLEAGLAAQRMDVSLQAALGSVEAMRGAQAFLRQESQRLGLVFVDQVQGYSRLAVSARAAGVATSELRNIYLGIAEASTALKLTQEGTVGVMRAFEQILSKGIVGAEEIRLQLGDRIPGAVTMAARAIGKTTFEFEKLLRTGQIMATDLVPKLAALWREEFGPAAEIAATQAQAGLNRLTNAWFEFRRALMEGGLIDEFGNQVGAIADQINEWVKANESLIRQKLPEILTSVKDSATATYEWFTSNKDLVEFGLLGFILMGRKGVAAGALAGYIYSYIKEPFDVIDQKVATALHMREAEIREEMLKIGKVLGGPLGGTAIGDVYRERLNELGRELETLQTHLKIASQMDVTAGMKAADLGKAKDGVKVLSKALLDEATAAATAKQDVAALATTLNNEASLAQLEAAKAAEKLAKEWEKVSDKVKKAADTLVFAIRHLEDVEDIAASIRIDIRGSGDYEKELAYRQRETAGWIQGEFDAINQLQDEVDSGIKESVTSLTKGNEEAYKRFLERVQDATADTFYDIFTNQLNSWEDLMGRMKDLFLRTLSEMLAAAIAKPIIVPIVASVAGAMGLPTGAAGATGSPASGAASWASSLGGWMKDPLWNYGAFGITPGPTPGGMLGAGLAGSMGYGTVGAWMGLPQGGYSGMGSGVGAVGGYVGGQALGSVVGGALGSVAPVIGTAIGAAAGGIIGSMILGADEKKAKLELGSGSQVQLGRPHVTTPFGLLGIDMASMVDTDQFKQTFDSIKSLTTQMASTMSESMVAGIKESMSDWSSSKIKGEMSESDIGGLFVDYFRSIGAAWNTEFGAWIAEFDGSLDDLMSGIQSHLSVMHEIDSILDPYGTAVKDTNLRFDTMRDTLLETGGSVAELSKVERARNITLQQMANQQQAVADAEYERQVAEMKRLAELKKAYQEWQVGLIPGEAGQQAQWGMIQSRWGVKSGMPSGAEAKTIIDSIANDTRLVDWLMSIGDAAKDFQADVGFVKGLADAFDQLVLSTEQSVESVLDQRTEVEKVNDTWDDARDALIAVGYQGSLLTDIESARTKQLGDLAKAERDAAIAEYKMLQNINLQSGQAAGMFNEKEIAIQSLTDTFMGFWDQIKDQEYALELFPELAARYGAALEKLNQQFESSYYSALAALPGLSSSRSKGFATSAIATKYGLSGSDITGGMVSNLYGLASSGKFSYSDVRTYLDSLGFKHIDVSEFVSDIGALHDLYFPKLEDAISGTSNALDELAREMEQLANEWHQVAVSARSDLERMRYTIDNPQSVLERMGLVRADIAALGTIDNPEEANKARELWNTLLELGKEAWQRPTSEYQSLYDEVYGAIEGLAEMAESEEVKLLRLIEENTRNTVTAVGVSASTAAVNTVYTVEKLGEFFSGFSRPDHATPAPTYTAPPSYGASSALDAMMKAISIFFPTPPSYNSSSDLADMMEGAPPSYQGGGIFSEQEGIAQLHGPEAIIPLHNGAVPVELKGAGETVVHITVQVTGDTNPAETKRKAREGVLEALRTPEAAAILNRNRRWGGQG